MNLSRLFASPTPRACPRILIADDDDIFREIAARALVRAGYDVIEVADGAEALACLQLHDELRLRALDAVLLDVHMPSITGLAVLEAMRAAGARMPVVLVTAMPDDEIHAAARRLGAATVLEKPLSMDALLTAVVNVTWLDAVHGIERVG